MLKMPNMLLIGSAGQSSGKTTLACKIIQKFNVQAPIYAVKIIAIDDANGRCHRGKQGCGICTSLKGNYDIKEELKKENEKDTTKMLQSGAKKAFLIRSLKPYLLDAFEEFVKIIPAHSFIICESNSVRNLVVPGVFLFVNNTSGIMKPSAKSVLPFADKVVTQQNQDDIIKRLIYVPQMNYIKMG